MQDSVIIEDNLDSSPNYNDEPVYYCQNCLSLKVMAFGKEDYCDICGSTCIGTTHIKAWERMYKDKYNKEFLTKK